MTTRRRRRRSRPSSDPLTRAPASRLIGDLATALAAERERRRAIEAQLAAQQAQLAELHRRVESLAVRSSDTDPQVGPPALDHAPKGRLVELARDSDYEGPTYWLRRCEGFEVDAGDDLIGVVEAVHFGRDHDRPDVLIVATAGWRRQLLLVPVETVAEISSKSGVIKLSADPREPTRSSDHPGMFQSLMLRLRQVAS